MKVTILGNNSALPGFGRHPSSQAVSVHGEMLLIDCGEGTQVQMQRYSVKWRKLHYIFISHLHGDHYFGLPGLLTSMSLMGRTEPLHLFAPAELLPILQMILKVSDTELSYPLHFNPLPGEVAVLASNNHFSVTCFPVIHRIACHGFLIEAKTRGRKILPANCLEQNIPVSYYEDLKHGADYTRPDGTIIPNDALTEEGPPPRRYAYCADTIYTESYLHLIQGVDAMYHESTYLEEDIVKAEARFHSTAMQAATLARKANAGRLLLGHFSSKYKELEPFQQEAITIFENTEVTVEGNVYEI